MRSRLFHVAQILLCLSLSACYSYKKPASELLGTTFNSDNREATDKMLVGMKFLSLTDAKHIAELNNQTYLALFHATDAARLRYYQSLGAYAPEIHIGTDVSYPMMWANDIKNPPPGVIPRNYTFSTSAGTSATWLLFDGLTRYFSVMAIQSEYKRQRAVQARDLCMLYRAVAYSYFDIQYASEAARIQRGNIDFQWEIKKKVMPQFEAGKRKYEEILNFEVIAAFAETTLLDILYQGAAADYSLALLMGYSEGALPAMLPLEDFKFETERMYYDVVQCINIALERSPEMHIFEQQLEMARYREYASYGAYFPSVYAYMGYEYESSRGQFRKPEFVHSKYSRNSMDYGIRADFLVFDGFARYNKMRETQAFYAVSEYEMAQTYLGIVNSIRTAYYLYETRMKQAAIYRSLLEKTLAQRDQVLELYLDGRESVDRLDRVQEQYVANMLQYAASVTDFKKSIAQLEAIMCVDVYLRNPEM